jgi:multidrug resistance efflux pump
MATLEIPELEAQMQEDQAAIKNATDEVSLAEHQLKRYRAQYKVLHLEYTRLNGVFESQPGLVAQQEVDDAQGKDLAAASQVDAGESALATAQSQLLVNKAKLVHDQALCLLAHHGAVFRRGDATLCQPGNLGAGGHELQHAGPKSQAAVRAGL